MYNHYDSEADAGFHRDLDRFFADPDNREFAQDIVTAWAELIRAFDNEFDCDLRDYCDIDDVSEMFKVTAKG